MTPVIPVLPYGGLMKEETIVENIKKYLKSVKGLFFWKEHGGFYGTGGIPDIIVCYRGKFIAFEVKQPGKTPTILQQKTMSEINNAGGWALKVESVKEVEEVINAFKNDF